MSNLTLDGVMQSNGGPEPELNDGFEQGGWQVPYFDDAMTRLMTGWIAAADAFLMGRRTYELFERYWSKITDPNDALGTRLNGQPKYVVSTTLDQVDWNYTMLLREGQRHRRLLSPPAAIEPGLSALSSPGRGVRTDPDP